MLIVYLGTSFVMFGADAASEAVPRIEGGVATICVKRESIRLSKYCAAYCLQPGAETTQKSRRKFI